MEEGGAPAPTADLTVVLFNCGTAKKRGDTSDKLPKPTRRDCVTQVLDALGNEPSLFLLVQDSITQQLNTDFSTKGRSSSAKLNYKEDVGIYDLSESDTYNVELIDNEALDPLTGTDDTGFKIDKAQTCVITQRNTEARVLLVSWHGPYNSCVTKKECFNKLIDFANNLRERVNCSAVIVGGDFNMQDTDATKYLDERTDQLQADVNSDYTQPPYCKGKKKDFIVYWPKQSYYVTASVIEPGDPHPFDHPIVRFRLQAAEPDTTAPDHPKEALQGDNEEVTQLTEKVNKLTIQHKTEEQGENEEDSGEFGGGEAAASVRPPP